MIAQCWGDQSDAARLPDDPVLAIAENDRAGVGGCRGCPGVTGDVFAVSGPAQSGHEPQRLETAPLELAARSPRAQGHKALSRITHDIDGLPLPGHGEQPGSAYNGHWRERIHHPLIASCVETGDLLAGLLRDGNAGPAQQAAIGIPRIRAGRPHTPGARGPGAAG
jgi:hypothetical protein